MCLQAKASASAAHTMAGRVQFRLSTAHTTTKPEIFRAFIDLTKDYVFENEIRLTFEGTPSSIHITFTFPQTTVAFRLPGTPLIHEIFARLARQWISLI